LTSWGTISQAFESPEVIVYHVADVSPAGVNNFTVPNPPEEMILGENGIAYLNYGGGATAFNIADGTTLWDYSSPSGGLTHLVNAVSGGGLIINDPTLGLISLDAAGNTTVTGTVATAPSPWSLGNWVGVVGDPVTAMFVGPSLNSTLLALSDFPMVQGSRQAGDGSPKPTGSTFITRDPSINPSTRYSAFQFPTEMQSNVWVPKTKAYNTFFLTQDATLNAFLTEVKKPDIAVAFIGDSFLITNPTTNRMFSIGLYLFDRAFAKTGNFQLSSSPLRLSQVPNQARVIFIASCDVGREFISLWGPLPSDGKRALIVPTTAVLNNPSAGPVDLLHAKTAWLIIAEKMMVEGTTAAAAVQAANDFMMANFFGERWKVVGDDNATLKAIKPQN
jgi:hypothetical protein